MYSSIGRVNYSASDLFAHLDCEHSTILNLVLVCERGVRDYAAV
jgi:hypothetical protein